MTNRIAIVGGFWGHEEASARAPFQGYSGRELTRMLEDAGISRADCLLTNVFNFFLESDKAVLEELCGDEDDGVEGYPAYEGRKFIRNEFHDELDRLSKELSEVDPNVILACGNQALWALLGRTKITKYRGTTELAVLTAPGRKVLPTYNPAAVTRNWDLRPTMVMDLQKAERQSHYPDLRRPHREIWIEPTIEDLYDFQRRFLRDARRISCDIETSGNQITCIGFAPDSRVAIVVPFYDRRKKGGRYWPDTKTERMAWDFVRDVLQSGVPKLFQNGLYDLTFILRATGIVTKGAGDDTMLLHHSLQPESLKSLGYLGSVYCDEDAWKHYKSDTIGADK